MAGTVTEKAEQSGKMGKLTLSWTADASAATVPAYTTKDFLGFVTMVTTNPGATAPTDNYDITITDSDGVDIMGGELANRDTTNTEQATPLVGATYRDRHVIGKLTLNISGNAVNSATGTVVIYYEGDYATGY